MEITGHKLVDNPDECDIILLWTCAFRKDYRDNSLNQIQILGGKNKKLIVCGCLPDIDIDSLKSNFNGEYFSWREESKYMPIIFNGKSESLIDIDLYALGERNISNIEEFKSLNQNKKVLFADEFVKLFVSEGCTFKCTYCAEILAFPEYRSFPVKQLLEKCKELIDISGQKKVVLWADSLGDYGKDSKSSLPELIYALIDEIDGIQIGLEHLHPARFIEYIQSLSTLINSNKIWLVDIPIQSASDKILKLMNRQYNSEDISKIFALINNCSFVTNIKTHVIVGFPGETIVDHKETEDFLIKYAPKSVLISGYMGSAGMPSEYFPDKVSFTEIRRRVLDLTEKLRKKGIVCNYDNSSISEEHFSKSFVDL